MDRALSSLSKLRAKSSKDLSGSFSSREFPSDPACYDLLEDCGRGVSATVHRAVCKATNEVVAVKKMNLERVNMKLEEIIHEAQTMKSYHHPNVLPLHTSFVHDQDLWMVTPFMSGGSVLHIMKYRFPKGLDEVSIATVMKYVLMGLEYVHKNQGIHRDVKAGNILMDRDGVVRIGDFGVAATPKMAERDGDWRHEDAMRNTFVGTPCWMAPEVMEQTNYNSKADIWSVGITLLELANGHAPFAKFPPMKVLLLTLQGSPPQLDDQPGRPHFSKHMRNVIARCLQKDPALRPSATELLQDKFFKQARDEEYLVRTLLGDLPALGERVQMIREGKAATNAAENDRQLERSQEEYKRGVSAWNFDVGALKAQAALQDDLDKQSLGLASIAEEPQPLAEAEGSGSSSSRRSTDDAAGIPPAQPLAAAAAATAAAAAAGSALQQQQQAEQQQQPDQLQQQQLQQQQQQQQQPAQVSTLQSVCSVDMHEQQQPQQHLHQQQLDAAAGASLQQQQQEQPNMRRAASAFAGSHAHAAAAADMGAAATSGSASSSTSGLLGSHYSEPSSSVSHQGSGIAGQQYSGSGGMPPPAPYAGAAYTGLSSGSLAGAVPSSGGSSTYCLSPPTSSPPMSRESSSQGPLASLTTPEALQLKGKSKGRFQVYEHGVPAPPLSPGARGGPGDAGLSGSFTKSTAAVAATAAAAVMAADTAAGSGAGGAAAPAGRTSDSAGLMGGSTTETPRAGRQVLNAAEAAELKAAAVAATAAAGTTGGGAAAPAAAAGAAAGAAGDSTAVAGGTGTCPTPPPGTGGAAGAAPAGLSLNVAGGTVSVDGAEAPAAAAAAAAPEPKKKGRFKIIEEDGPSRGPSKVPSSADLGAVARGVSALGGAAGSTSGRGLAAGSAGAMLPELLRLHEQSVSHANALARVIDSMRGSGSSSNLVADDLQLAGGGGGGGMLPPRKPAAGAAAAGGSGGVLSRVNSSRVLLGGAELKAISLQQLMQDSNGDAMEVAEKLFERVQDLERQLSGLDAELTRLRGPDPHRLLRPLEGSSTGQQAAAAQAESADGSRAASRRTSNANLALSAASPTAAAAAAAAAAGGVGGGSSSSGAPAAAAGPAAGQVARHSSSGASGGGGDSGGGAPPASGGP